VKAPAKRRGWLWLIVLLVLAAAGAAGYYRMQKTEKTSTLPTATVRKGEFLVVIRSRGDLVARRSAAVVSPQNIPDMRVVWQVPPNSEVKAGDPVIRLDPSAVRMQIAEKQANVQQSQATLDQALAQSRITSEQDKRDVSSAEYAVEKAEMEVAKQAIVSRLKGEESQIDLGLAKKRLSVLKATMAVHEASDKVRIGSLERQLALAKADIELNQSRLTQLELTAPINGVIVYTSFYQQASQTSRPLAVGDPVYSGSILAQVPDLSSIQMDAKIEEVDRGKVRAGMDARVRVDALPELNMEAKLGSISPLSQLSLRDWPITSSFRGYAQVLKVEKKLRPGMAGTLDIITQRIPNALIIPTKALFAQRGRAVVYVARAGKYVPVEVKVVARNPDELAVEGVAAGELVSLMDPATQSKEKKK